MRQLLGASGVALLVPGALVAAIATLALAGGFARLGAYSQVFSGPSLALQSAPSATAAAGTAAVSKVLASVGSGAVTPAPAVPPASRAGAAGSATPRTGTAPSAGGHSRTRGHSGTTGGTRHHPGHGPGHGGTHPVAKPPPQPPKTVVDAVASVVTSVSSQVPGPVGAGVTTTVNQVAAGVDRLLHK